MTVRMEKMVNERYTMLQTLTNTDEETVCLAEDCLLNQNVTLTVYRGGNASSKTKLREHAVNQAACSDIPQVIKVLDIFEEGQDLYVVSEYVQGIPLRQYLRQQTELLDFEQAWKLLRTVAEAAAAVRKKGQAFQTLDMDSVLVREDGGIKINTPLIPERPQEGGQSDDIRTLCAMLYEMTAGNGLSLYQQAALNRGMEAERRRQYSGIQELIRALDQEKGSAGKSRKRLFAGIAEGFLLILILAAVLVGKGILSGQSREVEALELAGNYDRGSPRYQEYVSFVKEHAVSEEETEDGIVYTLDEESVRKWNQPCNQFRFEMSADTVLKELEACGYELTKIDETEENTVEIQKYGAILTRFQYTETYLVLEGVGLAVVTDAVNGDLLMLRLYRGDDSQAPLHGVGADLLCILSEDWYLGPEETAAGLEADEQEAFETNGSYIQGQYIHGTRECRMDFYWGEADRVIRYLFHPNHDFEYYYWP